MMTPNQIRDAVRTLQTQGQSLRQISRVLKLSRNTVRRILRTASPAAQERQCLGVTLAYLKSAFASACTADASPRSCAQQRSR